MPSTGQVTPKPTGARAKTRIASPNQSARPATRKPVRQQRSQTKSVPVAGNTSKSVAVTTEADPEQRREEANRLKQEILKKNWTMQDSMLKFYEEKYWKELGHSTWGECIKKEFEMKPAYGYKVIRAARVARNLGGKLTERDKKVHRLSPLATLKSQNDQQSLWSIIKNETKGKDLTGEVIEDYVTWFVVAKNLGIVDEPHDHSLLAPLYGYSPEQQKVLWEEFIDEYGHAEIADIQADTLAEFLSERNIVTKKTITPHHLVDFAKFPRIKASEPPEYADNNRKTSLNDDDDAKKVKILPRKLLRTRSYAESLTDHVTENLLKTFRPEEAHIAVRTIHRFVSKSMGNKKFKQAWDRFGEEDVGFKIVVAEKRQSTATPMRNRGTKRPAE